MGSTGRGIQDHDAKIEGLCVRWGTDHRVRGAWWLGSHCERDGPASRSERHGLHPGSGTHEGS